jgi:hypothetical protein
MSLTSTRRRRRTRATTRTPSYVDPDRLYTRRGFLTAVALSEQRLREIRTWGIECRRFWLGRRCYYRGSDIIAYLELASAEEHRRSVSSTMSESVEADI